MTAFWSGWRTPTALLVLSAVPAMAGVVRMIELAHGKAITPENARFFAAPLPMLLHIPAVLVFSMLGAFQFSPHVRHRRPGWHRAAGKLVLLSGLLAGLSGLWMTLWYPWPAGDGVLLFSERLVAGSAMLWSLAMSLLAIRRRAFAEHGDWMVRAYAIGMGAGTQVFTHLPWFLLVDRKPGELPRAMMMGAGWVINALVAEWIVRRRGGRSRTRRVHLQPDVDARRLALG